MVINDMQVVLFGLNVGRCSDDDRLTNQTKTLNSFIIIHIHIATSCPLTD